VQLLAGNLDAAIEYELKALRLNPYGMISFMAHDCLARAYFLREQIDEARNWAEKALTENSAYLPGLRTMAAIEATAGNLERAKQLANRVLEKSSSIAAGRSTTAGRLRNDEHRHRFIEALRLAGLPG
jgi:tetratricopeptide (TPR) repeat protein